MYRRTFARQSNSLPSFSPSRGVDGFRRNQRTAQNLMFGAASSSSLLGSGLGASTSQMRWQGWDGYRRSQNMGGGYVPGTMGRPETDIAQGATMGGTDSESEENTNFALKGVVIKPDSTLVSLWKDACSAWPLRKFIGTKMWVRGQLSYMYASYNGIDSEIDVMIHMLHSMGVRKGSRIVVISDNRYEWFVLFQATLALGAHFVGVPTNVTPQEAQKITFTTGAVLLFVETQASYQAVKPWAQAMEQLRHVICFDDPSSESSYAVVIGLAESVPLRDRYKADTKVHPDDTAAILFTAGTTGPPKGCMLSHRCLVANVSSSYAQFGQSLSFEDTFLSLCPWTVAGCLTLELYQVILTGAAVTIPPEILEGLGDMQEVNPSVVVSPPLPFQRMYNNIFNDIVNRGMVHKWMTKGTIGTVTQSRAVMEKPPNAARVGMYLFMGEYKKQFGTDLRMLVIVGGALTRDQAELLADMDLYVCSTYGCLEAGGVLATDMEVMTRLKVLPGVELRVVNEENQVVVPGDIGEILVEAPHAMQGYFDTTLNVNEEDGALVVHGNRTFVRTGDYGSLNGSWLTVNGNKDILMTLANGKIVDPLATEAQATKSPFIKQCFVFGDRRDYVVALIVPLVQSISQHLKKVERRDGVPVVNDREKADAVRAELRRVCEGLPPHAHVRRFAFVEDMNQANGFLTCKMSYARQKIESHYVHYINQLYDETPKFYGYAVDDWDDLF